MKSEKRLELRKTFSSPVKMHLVGMTLEHCGRESQIECDCLDVSSSGVGLVAGQKLLKGDVLKLAFAMSNPEVTLPVLSEVAWSEKAADHYRIGLRFLA